MRQENEEDDIDRSCGQFETNCPWNNDRSRRLFATNVEKKGMSCLIMMIVIVVTHERFAFSFFLPFFFLLFFSSSSSFE